MFKLSTSLPEPVKLFKSPTTRCNKTRNDTDNTGGQQQVQNNDQSPHARQHRFILLVGETAKKVYDDKNVTDKRQIHSFVFHLYAIIVFSS